MKVIETTVYTFDELTDEAKEKAREWWRSGGLDYEWWDCTIDDAAQIGVKIEAFDTYHGTISGKLTLDLGESIVKVLENHGPMCETYKTAQRFSPIICEATDEAEYLHAILEDYRIMLQKEEEYLLSDEAVDESIKCNEYTFTETGKRFG